MNKFCEIIYHPSRFVPHVCINILIYRYLNGVIDASKTEKPSRYPSRFGVIPHDFLTTLYQILHIIVESIAMASEKGCIRERLRFHGMKHFVLYHETVRSKRRNTLFHPVKQADTSQSCFRRVQSL